MPKSIIANKNFLLPEARGRIPMISIPHWAKGHELVEGSSPLLTDELGEEELALRTLANVHLGDFLHE